MFSPPSTSSTISDGLIQTSTEPTTSIWFPLASINLVLQSSSMMYPFFLTNSTPQHPACVPVSQSTSMLVFLMPSSPMISQWMEALHLLLINLTNDPGFGGPGKLLLWPPAIAAGALPHCYPMVIFSFEIAILLPLPPASSSSLLDFTVFCRFFAVFAAFGAVIFILLLVAGFILLLFTNFITWNLFTEWIFNHFNLNFSWSLGFILIRW